jgi:hypothetical protein
MSTIKTINVQHPSSATINLVTDSSGNVSVGGGLTTAGTVAMGSSFMRNRIINGAMVVDQRNAGASGTASGYTVDRFAYYGSQASKGTWQQNAGSVTPPAGFKNYLGFTSSSAYSVLSTDEFEFYQSIEGYNVADLGWGAAGAQTVTLSFWVRSSLTGTFGGALQNSAANRSYPYSYTISAANTWEQKTITVPGDTSGTWLTTNGIGVAVYFGLGVGSTKSGTAGAWSGSYLTSATGATSVVGTNGATFYITGVQLEVGSVATPFEREIYSQTLAKCFRYFRQYSSVSNTNASTPMIGTGQAKSGGTAIYRMGWTMDIAMRASPSVTFSGMSCWAGSNVPSVSTGTNYSGSMYVDLDCTTSGLTLDSNGCVAKLYFPNTSGYVQVSAEL